MGHPANLDDLSVLIDRALEEDVGTGDITTLWTIPADATTIGTFTSRFPGIISGLNVAEQTFKRLDPDLVFQARIEDGDSVKPGVPFAQVQGHTQSILTGERTALNFLRHLSGIATLAERYAEAVSGTGTRVVDTRKTLPGFRSLEKRAVSHGGAGNHRFGLYDMILIKDNHIAAAGSITRAVNLCRHKMAERNQPLKIEVEAESFPQVDEAARLGVDRIMLDNMSLDDMQAAVEHVRAIASLGDAIEIEASGAITLDRVPEVAATGVDLISIGALTHSVTALDISLNIN